MADDNRGKGTGTGGDKQKDGGAGTCVCPKCGWETEHVREVPCNKIECEKCGALMAGKSKPFKELQNVLGHIALLGGEMPAVKTLKSAGVAELGANGEGWIEAFDVGMWKGTKVTPAIIKSLIKNFIALTKNPDVDYKPALVVGHDESDGLQSGVPAAGWITNLKTKGTKLMAYVTDVPDKIRALINAKRYRTVSLGYSGKFTYSSEGSEFGDMETETIEERSGYMTDLKALEEKNAALETKLKEAETKLAEFSDKETDEEKAETEKKLKELSEENEKLTAEIEKGKAEADKARNETRVEKLIEGKKIFPAFKETVLTHIADMNDEDFKTYADKLPEINTDAVIESDDDGVKGEKAAISKARKEYKTDPHAKEFGLTEEEYVAGAVDGYVPKEDK